MKPVYRSLYVLSTVSLILGLVVQRDLAGESSLQQPSEPAAKPL
jgi:hypothetical protein